MSTIMHDSTTETEHHPSAWDNLVWAIGCRTHSFGEYLIKLGDRIHGDGQMGLEEAGDLGYSMGHREGLSEGGGHLSLTLTRGLKRMNLTPQGLAAETKIAEDRLGELQGNARATWDEICAIEHVVDRFGSRAKALAVARRQAATLVV